MSANLPKHTPGPWRVLDDREPGGAGFAITSDAGGVVALVTRPPSREADAKLIAAAPDLAEALEKCRSELRNYVRSELGDTMGSVAEAIAEADAALISAGLR